MHRSNSEHRWALHLTQHASSQVLRRGRRGLSEGAHDAETMSDTTGLYGSSAATNVLLPSRGTRSMYELDHRILFGLVFLLRIPKNKTAAPPSASAQGYDGPAEALAKAGRGSRRSVD